MLDQIEGIKRSTIARLHRGVRLGNQSKRRLWKPQVVRSAEPVSQSDFRCQRLQRAQLGAGFAYDISQRSVFHFQGFTFGSHTIVV